jgi:hypothetical protein
VNRSADSCLRRAAAACGALLWLPLTLSAPAPLAAVPPAIAEPVGSAPTIATAPELFPRPAELQPDINFWLRVYTQVTTNEGLVHDQRNLAVVYEKLSYQADLAPKERQARVDAVRERYQAILKYLGTGAAARDAEDQRVRDLWPATASAARLTQAADDVRFQLGQSDRFRAGLARAGAWEAHIAATIAARAGGAAACRVLFRPRRLFQSRRCRLVAVHALHRQALYAH